MSETTEHLTAARAEQDDLRERLMTLAAASTRLLVSPSVEDVLPATLRLAAEMVEADGYAVWRRDERVWRIGASQGMSGQFVSTFGTLIQRGQSDRVPLEASLFAADVDQMPRLESRRDAYKLEGIRSLFTMPLTIRGEPSGALVFYYRRTHQLSEVETRIALALGNLASAAITTAELYDEQKRIRRQSDFLAETGAVLAKSMDYHVTLTRVAELAVAHISDWCVVDLIAENGAIERMATAHLDPARIDIAGKIRERFQESPNTRFTRVVVQTAQAIVVEHVSDETLTTITRDEEHFNAMRELGVVSLMCTPLIARGRTLGAMTFAMAESGRHYDATDLKFANDIASRVALAVDNSRAYEEARRASQLKDEFLATLSHELRTPLNAILGYARMLKSGMLDAQKQTRGLEVLERNASSLTQIVEDVLDVSRIISGKLALNVKPVDLAVILAQGIATMQPAAEAKGVRIQTVIFDPVVTPVAGDADRLQQVIWNLVSNAVKFTPRGEGILVQLARTDSHVEITVSDTGTGISQEFLPHIFERFRQADGRFSRQHGGLGLGLSISRQIVEMHGGTIEAASAGVGEGATFTVRLPIMNAIAGLPPRRGRVKAVVGVPRPQRTRLDSVRVVAVDDDDDALEMLREILEAAGAKVMTARTGAEALHLLTQERPQVLVCDIGMPGMDGFELITRVRHLPVVEGGGVPAAALTAYARSEDRTRALRAGYQMHLSKPIDPEELLASVKALSIWDESMF